MRPSTTTPLIDTPAAAKHLGVTERWVRRAVQDRKLPHVKVGRYVRFRKEDLDAYIAKQRRAAGAS